MVEIESDTSTVSPGSLQIYGQASGLCGLLTQGNDSQGLHDSSLPRLFSASLYFFPFLCPSSLVLYFITSPPFLFFTRFPFCGSLLYPLMLRYGRYCNFLGLHGVKNRDISLM